ncbi:MAG: hypothetical protein AAFN93_04245 [Bacteroidota bacterium]
MSELLHVLNGDSSKGLFEKTSLKGDVMLWREMLSEGKSDAIVASDLFWNNRRSHLQNEMDVSKDEYDKGVVVEFNALKKATQYDEVILWFEYDLFCQINILATLSYLQQLSDYNKVSLVCVGKFPWSERLLGLGELEPNSFQGLFEERKELTKEDISYAHNLWKVYSSVDHNSLKELLKNCPSSFEYLPQAILGHLERFPQKEHGLNAIEYSVLRQIEKQSGKVTKNNLIRDFLIGDQVYGVGDWIFEGYLQKISPLYEVNNDVFKVSSLGNKILEGQESFAAHRQDYYFGGCHIKSFYWRPDMQNIVPSSDFIE